MAGNILEDIKKPLGLAPDYDAFDAEITMHINSQFSTLFQLGVGPKDRAFVLIDGDETWDEFFAGVVQAPNLNDVKTYIYMRVRLIFDPPATSFAITSMEKMIQEAAWRMNVQGDHSSINNQ